MSGFGAQGRQRRHGLGVVVRRLLRLSRAARETRPPRSEVAPAGGLRQTAPSASGATPPEPVTVPALDRSSMRSSVERRHTVAVLVENEPGTLARVIGLFSGRGYNIDSLTVAEVDRANGLSRITVVTHGTPAVIEQIKALLAKLVPVHRVQDLTLEGPAVERELALVKVAGSREQLVQALRIADVMHARLVDSAPESFVFEITGTTSELDAFISLLDPIEVARAGIVAMARGTSVLASPVEEGR